MKKEQINVFLALQDINIVDAMQKIDNNGKGILFVVDDKQKLKGTITDGDIRRWLIKTGNMQAKIKDIMNPNPLSIYKDEIKNASVYMKRNSITAVPVLNTYGKVIDIILKDNDEYISDKIDSLKNIPVVIMAGGKGTRLYPYTKILPKPLIPIGDIPIMERIMNNFCDYWIDEFYITVNYKKNMIKSYFADNPMDCRLNYVEENQPLGTAGSLRLINKEFCDPLFVTNCDILINADYSDIYKYHNQSKNELTVVSALKNIVVPYGVINSAENGVIETMEEKPKLSYFVNTGMYVLNPNLIKEIPDNTFYHMTDLVNKLLNEKRKVGMYPISEDSFLDMGEFEEMHRMEKKLDLKTGD